MSSEYKRWITARDIGISLYLFVFAILSVVTPVKRWSAVSRRFAKLLETSTGSRLRAANELSGVAAMHPAFANIKDVSRLYAESYVMTRLQLTDQNLLRKWQPDIEVQGGQLIADALQAGNGVIVWVTPLAYSDLVAKMGLAKAGFAVSHLSRPGHGFSRSRFGVRFLNGMRTRIENRYLHERIRIHKGEERQATLAMRRTLKKNGVLSITVGAQSRSSKVIPLKGGYLRLADGPVRLAKACKAPILPVFAIQMTDSLYRVNIHPSILDQSGDELAAMQKYTEYLEDYLGRFPEQWRGMHDFLVHGNDAGS